MGKHKVLILILILSVLALSGCSNDYPKVIIDPAPKENYINIDIGQPYVYKGFDINNTDKGKDFILHFTEGE